jgi:hypothetical protein
MDIRKPRLDVASMRMPTAFVNGSFDMAFLNWANTAFWDRNLANFRKTLNDKGFLSLRIFTRLCVPICPMGPQPFSSKQGVLRCTYLNDCVLSSASLFGISLLFSGICIPPVDNKTISRVKWAVYVNSIPDDQGCQWNPKPLCD